MTQPPLDAGKRSVLGVLVSVIDLETAAQRVIEAARAGRVLTLTALAVHGVMTGVASAEQKYRLNHLDIVTPDGQPVRWALRLLYRAPLKQRVYGPDLTLRVCALAEEAGLPVYFYGSTPDVIDRLRAEIARRFPRLVVAGAEPSLFRRTTTDEQMQIAARIRASGARIVFCGLGCPRQETWAFEYRDRLGMPVLAVGAAFDFLGGSKAQAPRWMQDRGLEWLFRLLHEPRRLWRRYLLLNPAYLGLLALQLLRLKRYNTTGRAPVEEMRFG